MAALPENFLTFDMATPADESTDLIGNGDQLAGLKVLETRSFLGISNRPVVPLIGACY